MHRSKLRGTDEVFALRLLSVGVCRTNTLESLVIACFARALSDLPLEYLFLDGSHFRRHEGAVGLVGVVEFVFP